MKRFHNAFAGTGVAISHLALFDKPNVPNVAAHLSAQDVIWVDRGSVINLLAVWVAHGLDGKLQEGCATDTGAGVHFEGTSFVTAISDRPNANAYKLRRRPDGTVQEEVLGTQRPKRSA